MSASVTFTNDTTVPAGESPLFVETVTSTVVNMSLSKQFDHTMSDSGLLPSPAAIEIARSSIATP